MKKFFTLFAALVIAIAANAGSTTAKFGSANNSDKDTEVKCPGFTIDGTYVAGGNSKVNVYGDDKGMKMRANKTENTLILKVDENTTITALAMGIVTNDAEQTLPISAVLVDGETVDLNYPIATYNTSTANGTAVINLTDIEATKTIGIKFNPSDYTAKNVQVFIAGEVTFTDGASDDDPSVLWKSETAEGVLVDWGQAAFFLTPEEAADIKIGDTFHVTVAGVTEGGWPQVCIFDDQTGAWVDGNTNMLANTGVGGKEYPYVASFGITGNQINRIHENGISFGGNGAYVSAVSLEKSPIEISDDAVWFGPKQCDWGDPATVSKDIFADVKVGDKIEVEYDTSYQGMNVNLLFGGWSGCPINIGRFNDVEFITQDTEKGIITINLTSEAENFDNWANDPSKDEAKDWNLLEQLKTGGFFVQGPSIINQIIYIPGEEAEPTFPETFEYTLNGEKELPGVSVDFTDSGWGPTMNITGTSDAEEIAVTFAVPEGWDGWIISADYAEVSDSNNSTFSTRGEYDWGSLDQYTQFMGYKKGNTVTFPVEEEGNYAMLGLYVGDKVYNTGLTIEYNVTPASSSDEPLIPESIVVTTFDEGLVVSQDKDQNDGAISVEITGTVNQEEYSIVLDVPEGWDGYVCFPWFSEVEIEESQAGAKKIAATDHDWSSIEDYLADGYTKGNKLTFKANGYWSFVDAFLYKGDQVDYNAYISITAQVERQYCKVTTSIEDLEVTQEEYDGVVLVNVNGSTTESEYQVTVEPLEGYDGFLAMTDTDMYGEGEPLKKIGIEPEWFPISALMEEGFKISNTLTFPIDGEEHFGQLIPYKGEEADVANFINVNSYVTKPQFPEEIEVSTSNETLIVEQAWNSEEERYNISITGEITAKSYVAELEVPDGWTGYMALAHDDEGVSMRRYIAGYTEADWLPISEFEKAGFVSSNNFKINTGDEPQYIDLYLYKDDQVDYNAYIQLTSEVKRAAFTGPEFPRELDITTDAEGVEITQFTDFGTFTVGINGESAARTFNVEIGVPAGWDGFLIQPWSDNVVANESLINPRNVAKAMDPDWEPFDYDWRNVDDLLAGGYVKGNSLTITADGQDIDCIAYLYKGDQVEIANGIYFEGNVVCTSGVVLPQFPYSFDVTPDNWDVYIWQGGVEDMAISGVTLDEVEAEMVSSFMAQTAIVATGKTDKETVSLTFDLPEGWAGVLPLKLNMTPIYGDDDYLLNTRANESEWAPFEEYMMSLSWMSWFDTTAVEPGNPLVFPANGEKQVYLCNLYLSDPDGILAGDPEFAGDYVDVANTFVIVVKVEGTADAVESINAIDSNATYYDVNGNKVATPAKGVYVKVVDGKASKVVVK